MSRIAIIAALVIGAAAAQADFWVSVGSYKTTEAAERGRAEATSALGAEFSLVGAETSRGYYYRVVGGPYTRREDADAAMAVARAGGYAGAWLISDSARTMMPLPSSTSTYDNTYNDVYDYRASPPIEYDTLDADRRSTLPDYSTPDYSTPDTSPYQPTPLPDDYQAPRVDEDLKTEAPPGYRLHKLRRDAKVHAEDRGPESGPVSLRLDGDRVEIVKRGTAEVMKIDGRLSERAWEGLPIHDAFFVTSPDTLEPSPLATEVRVFYTDRGLYLGARMAQDPATLVERLSSRDQGFLNRDYFSFTLDTSGEGRYGYWFQLNLGDSISDGTILPERQYSDSWDGAWHGATSRNEHGWVAEYYIPWSLVSMPQSDGERSMGLYASRQIAHLDERVSWPALPFTKPQFLSAFQSLGLKDVNPRQQISLFPYASTTYDRLDGSYEHKLGTDFFWRPSTNFQVTATANPDFGNVETDDVIVNLTAFETFFPEKRLFFQEGQEIFVTSPRGDPRQSFDPVMLLNTRRIGSNPIPPDIPDGVVLDGLELQQPADILGAVKAVGQFGRLRYGVLTALEDDSEFRGSLGAEPVRLTQEGREYGVFRLLYEDVSTGYRALGLLSTGAYHPTRDAMTHGVDGHYQTIDGAWKLDAQVMTSDVSDEPDGYGGFLDVAYAPRQGLTHNVSLDYYDTNLDIRDLGFLRRNDSRSVRYRLRSRRSNLDYFKETSTRLFVGGGWNDRGENIMSGINFRHDMTLPSLAQITVGGGFSPARFDDRNSFGNGSFRIADRFDFELRYRSDTSRRFYYDVRADWLEEDLDGDRFRSRNSLVLRPNDRMTVGIGIDYTTRDGWLLHQDGGDFTTFDAKQWQPRLAIDYFLTAKQHLKLALQWVGIRSQERDFYRLTAAGPELVPVVKDPSEPSDDFTISSLNFQMRYRWEIAPLSDLFVVYTKNALLPSAVGSSFGSLFSDAFDNPLAEQLVVKLRYRLGS